MNHEILFDKNIDLEKYMDAVIVSNEIKDNTKKLLRKKYDRKIKVFTY